MFDGVDRLTFADGWGGICRVGHALDRDGFEPGAHVGLLLRNQLEFLPAFYGPQVRGGVSIPLNADGRVGSCRRCSSIATPRRSSSAPT